MLVYYLMAIIKETLTQNKMHELLGANYQFVEWFDYDTGCLNNGVAASKEDNIIYNNFRNILKKDARFNKSYELVAVVSLSISPYSGVPYIGKVIRNPRYAKPSIKFLGQTGYAGTIVCRDKKSGKILTIPNKWFYTGFSTCIKPGVYKSLGLPGLANLIDSENFCAVDNEVYQKLIQIQVFERNR